MTLTEFSLIVGVIAIGMTYLMKKKSTHLLMSFLQNFLGVFFIVSGFVKAVDPLGTAYKMEEYFENFYYTFDESPMKAIAPIFTDMAEYAVIISVGMIIFEIILGVMLILGYKPKLTAWLFFLIMVIYTALTGFTYLNGYVPEGVNFFEFSKWGDFAESQMKVTDCGCFGDFIKISAFDTFMKNVVILFPALFFLFKSKWMHQLFSSKTRSIIVGASTLIFLVFSWSNYIWDIPVVDFRPFKVGVNIREQAKAEADAEAAVEIISYICTNKKTGEVVEIPYKQYLKEYKSYPREEWTFEQNKTEPSIPHTKISDFLIQDMDGEDFTDSILNDPGYAFMIVSKGLKKDISVEMMTVQDTTFIQDTIVQPDGSQAIVTKVGAIEPVEVEKEIYHFPEGFVKPFKEKIVPLAQAAKKAGVKTYMIIGMEDPEVAKSFAKEIGADFPIYMADNILLKTIVRSNPGTVLMHDGKILGKWHHRKLPMFDEIKAKLIR
ncbi:MAG TPA: DoxX family protein [Saprospiraceae bacterium]|nr:DoxX family protein [Saprospiraceae bacterium]